MSFAPTRALSQQASALRILSNVLKQGGFQPKVKHELSSVLKNAAPHVGQQVALIVKQHSGQFTLASLCGVARAFSLLEVSDPPLWALMEHEVLSRGKMDLTPSQIAALGAAFAHSKSGSCELFGSIQTAYVAEWSQARPSDTVKLARALVRMRYYAADFFSVATSRLDEAWLQSVSQPELAGIAHAIAYFNHPSSAQFFAQVESGLDAAAVRSLAARDLCMILWSFAAVDVFSERVFLAALARGSSITARPIDLYQLYQADLSARVHLGGGDGRGQQGFLPIDFRESARKLMAGDHHRASGSETQVLAALARLGLVCEPQARTDVGYSVDIKVRDMVAIEFNGAVHYGTHLGPDGAYMTPRPLGGTLLKERHLRGFGWSVVTIPFWEWDALRDLPSRCRYLTEKLAGVGVNVN